VACAAIGLGQSTFFRWMQDGEDHTTLVAGVAVFFAAKSPYKEFREAVQKAQAQAEMYHMEAIRDAAFELVKDDAGNTVVRVKTWQASAWFLERTNPNRYGRQILEHTGEGGGPIRTEKTVKVVRFGGRYKQDGSVQTSAKGE
jgi:hypothetical protein